MKKFAVLFLAIAMIISMAACGGRAPASSAAPGAASANAGEKYVWKIAYMGNAENVLYQGIAKFKEEIESRVGDRVTIQVYLNGELGTSPDQTIGGVQAGTIDFCEATLGNVAEFSTAFMPTNLPYLFLNREIAFELVDGEVGDKMKQKYEEDTGVKLLCYWENGYRQMTNSVRPITSPEDCKGLKIRTMSNPIHMEGVSALGIAPTPMAWGDLMPALQQGTVDGQENPSSMIRDQKLYEMQKYMTVTDHFFDLTGLHMNAEYYNNLPEDIRKAIDEAAAIAEEYGRKVIAEAETKAVDDLIAEPSIEVTVLTPEQKAKFREVAKTSWTKIGNLCDQKWIDMVIAGVEAIEAGK